MQYAIANGIIDITSMKLSVDMSKRKEILNKHPNKIWHGKDGYWRTYVHEETGRRMLKKNTLEELEQAIVDFYKGLNKRVITFEKAYYKWRESHDKLVGDNTIVKYDTDYERYFANTKFVKMDVNKLTEENIKVFIVETTQNLKLCKKATKTLFLYIRGTLRSAEINHYIKESPMKYMAAKDFFKYATVKRDNSKKLFTDKEMHQLYQQIQLDYQLHPDYIPTYALELASLTGMRVGELAALRWDAISDQGILIDKSEKYNRRTKEYYIDTTKNEEIRTFPMTEEIQDLLRRIQKAEIRSGVICEWVFANEKGRIHTILISSCLRNKCKQAGIPMRGIHAFRRTLNSKLRCSGVSSVVAAALLGHSKEVNDQYYTFDITTSDDKAQIVSLANKQLRALA